LDCSIFTGVNTVLRKLPIHALSHFVTEFYELLNYTVLLQAAIEVCASEQNITEGLVVYRGLRNEKLAEIYTSAIGKVVIWPAFTTASRDITCVASEYASGDGGILFEISLGPGTVAAEIGHFSNGAAKSEVIIAAESAFRIDKVEEFCIGKGRMPMVCMTYVGNWSDRDLECDIFSFTRNTRIGVTRSGIR
jgi:hypothetical protein